MGDADRFQIVRPLGVAGTASVARDTSVTPAVPVVLERIVPSDPTVVLARARALAALEHPKVVAVRDVLEKDGTVILVSEFVDGEWLSALMALEPKPPVELLMRIVLDVLEGLAALHDIKGEDGRSLSFVHGALSPDSVLVAEDGVAEIARVCFTARPERGDRYVAPELRLGETASDVESDIYSVGAILKEVLGAAPASAKWAEQLTDIAWRACSVEPENRWPSAAAMATTVRRMSGSRLGSADDLASFVRKNFGARIRARRAALDILDEAPPPSSADPISIRPQDMLVIDPQSAPTLVAAPTTSQPPPVPAKAAVARVALVKKAVEPAASEAEPESEPTTTRRPVSAAPSVLESPPAPIAPMLPPPDIVPDVPAEPARAVPQEPVADAYRRRMPTFPTVHIEPPRRSVAAQAMGIAAAMVTTFGVGWWLGHNHPPATTLQPACAPVTSDALALKLPPPLSVPVTAPVLTSAGPITSTATTAGASDSLRSPTAPASAPAAAPSWAVAPAPRSPGTTAPRPSLDPGTKPVEPATAKPVEPPRPPAPAGSGGYVPSEL